MRFNQYLGLLLYFHCSESIRILCFLPVPSISHQIVFQPIWKELSLRGHDVTVITPNPLNDKQLSNLTEIDVHTRAYEYLIRSNHQKKLDTHESVFSRVLFFYDIFHDIIMQELENDEVSTLIKSNRTFDLIMVQGQLIMPLVYGFGAKYKSPVIALSSLEVFLHTHDNFGNPTHPIVSPDMMLALEGQLSFANKLESFLFNIWYRIYYYWYALPRADRTARKYFGDDIPYLGDIERNTSLLLINVNPVMHHVRPNVPNIVEINQMHIKKKKPLPEDIQEYLDSSPQGVIYFSLGSNVKSVNLTMKMRTVIIDALTDLPYNVIWKWENDYMPGKPDNVMLKKWLPQQDIMGHPNVKVFVTQGGLQSIEEAITNEVPMVGLPFITDQPANVRRIVKLGMGKGLEPRQMTKEQLRDAILEVAESVKYKEKMKHYRAILTDQPMKGVEKAIWWIEYVIRHKGAKHLRSAAADMSFYEYFMVDVILFLIVCVISMIYVIVKVSQFMWWITRTTRNKVKIN